MSVEADGVHGAVVHLRNFICNASGFVLLGGNLLDEFTKLGVVVLGQLVETAIAGVFGGQGVSVGPSTRGIAVEVGAGKCSGVEIGKVDARSEGRRGAAAGREKGDGHKGKDCF